MGRQLTAGPRRRRGARSACEHSCAAAAGRRVTQCAHSPRVPIHPPNISARAIESSIFLRPDQKPSCRRLESASNTVKIAEAPHLQSSRCHLQLKRGLTRVPENALNTDCVRCSPLGPLSVQNPEVIDALMHLSKRQE